MAYFWESIALKKIQLKREKTKKSLCRVVCVLLTVVLIMGAFWFENRLTERTDGKFRLGGFVEYEGDYDVLFFGTSLMANALIPMELWDKYGITSFNLSGPGNNVAASYWVFRNAMDYHKPKVVVFDVKRVEQEVRWVGTTLAHDTFDVFPLTFTKCCGIVDLFRDMPSEYGSREAVAFEFAFPYALYHNRWESVDYNMISHVFSPDVHSNGNGAMEMWNMGIYQKGERISQNEHSDIATVGHTYLQKVADYCNENNIKLIFVGMPQNSDIEEQLAANEVQLIAERNGVPFLNLQYEEMVSFETDFCDGLHLNRNGACKFTNYIGDYLTKEIGLGGKQDKFWDDQYMRYESSLLETMVAQPELKLSLLGFYNAYWDGIIMTDDLENLTPEEKALIRQLSNVTVTEDKNLEAGTIYMEIIDQRTGECVESVEFAK